MGPTRKLRTVLRIGERADRQAKGQRRSIPCRAFVPGESLFTQGMTETTVAKPTESQMRFINDINVSLAFSHDDEQKVFPRGDVHYAVRSGNVTKALQWTGAVADVRSFSDLVEREVPCDWSPERDGHPRTDGE